MSKKQQVHHVYLFTAPKMPPLWVEMQTRTIFYRSKGSVMFVTYASIERLQAKLDQLENKYGQPPIRLHNFNYLLLALQ